MFGNFGGNQNNNGAPSINTKIRTMFGETASLQLSYWNENLSIKINPLIGVNEQGIRQYDYTRRGSTALTPDKCIALAEKIKNSILPTIEKVKVEKTLENPVNIGFSVGNKGSAFFIEYKNDEKGTPCLYASLFTNIGQDNKAPKDGIYSYKFTKNVVVENYDPETGAGEESFVEAEFLYFYEKIKNIADMAATAAHSITLDKTQHPQAVYSLAGSRNTYSGAQSTPNAPVSNFSPDEIPF